MDMLRCLPALLRRGLVFAIALPMLSLAGCSSPTDKANEFYREGMALLEQGRKDNLVQADTAFRNALEIKKTLTPAIYGLALVAEKQGKFREMFSYLSQVVEQDPNHLQAQVKIGRMLLDAGQLEQAIESGKKAQALRADDPSVQILQAGILLKQGNRPAALDLLGKVLASDPGNADAYEFLAVDSMKTGDFGKAVEYADRALAARAGHVPALIIKVQALENLSQREAAEDALRKLIELQPGHAAFRSALIQMLVRHGRKDAAEAELRETAARNPGDVQARMEVVRFVQATRGPMAARKELESYIVREPGNHELKFALAGLLHAQNDRASAEALVRTIMAEAGDSRDRIKAEGILAAYLLEGGDKKSALALVEKILAGDTRNEQALILKASVALDENRIDEAISNLRAILHDTPDSPRALLLLARAHEKQGAPDLAEDHYARAFQAGRMEASYGLAYAEFLMRRGQSVRAEKLLAEMLGPNPGNLPVLRLLAKARSNRGDWGGAREAMDEVQRRGG